MSDFYDQVLSQLRHVSQGEREAIRDELKNHVEDHAFALEEAGYAHDEARVRALEAMGDPEEIGRELAKQYSLFWLVFSRLATAGIVLLCLSLLFSMPIHRLYLLSGNLTARLAPEKSGFASVRSYGSVANTLDLRIELGSDILYVYKIELDPEAHKAAIFMCNYDRNPLGTASSSLLRDVRFTTKAGETKVFGGGGGGNTGAYFWCARGIQAGPEDTCLYLSYDHFGTQGTLKIPLDWGDAA